MQKLRHPIGNCFRGVCRIDGGNFIDFVHIEYVGAIICVGVLHGIFVGAFLVVAVGIPCGDFVMGSSLSVSGALSAGVSASVFSGRGLLMVGLCGGGVSAAEPEESTFSSVGEALSEPSERSVSPFVVVSVAASPSGVPRTSRFACRTFCQNRRGTEVRKCHTARQQKREPALQGAFVSHTLLLLRRIGLLELLTG